MTNGVIVDSSVWIDFLNLKNTELTEKCSQLIFQNKLILIPIIIQEILQGISDENNFKNIKNTLLKFPRLNLIEIEIYISAAEIYSSMRKRGLTIRKPIDCLIAAICIKKDLALLHNDKDFTQIAKYTNLKIYNQNT